MNLMHTLNRLREEWSIPRFAIHSGEKTYSKLLCTFPDKGVNQEELDKFPIDIPIDLIKFWRHFKSACLFKDIEYGQWGLKLLTPEDVKKETAKYFNEWNNDCQNGDLIIGKFVGDQDMVLIRCDKKNYDFGYIMVVVELTQRSEWYVIAKNFSDFLEKYLEYQGDKYWELYKIE